MLNFEKHQNIQLMMITAIPEIAAHIENLGVGRIFLDMEYIGKHDRQSNMGLPFNVHSFEDVLAVKKATSRAEIMLRINPLHQKTPDEVEKAIDCGVDCIMFPFFHHQDEVKKFLDLVDGRVKTNILLETAAAVGRAEQIMSLDGLNEVHFGLNDLRISFKHDFLFESFAGGIIDFLCQMAREKKLSYGIGGVGRVGKEMLPADLIIKEHVRLKSQRVILSRVFHGEAQTLKELISHVDFAQAILDIRRVESQANNRSKEDEEKDRLDFCQKVQSVAQIISQKKPE